MESAGVMSLRLPIITCEPPKGGESKFSIPSWAGLPTQGVALHVIKDGSTIKTLKLDDGAKYYVFGRAPKYCCSEGKPIYIAHPSLSRQHSVIVHAGGEASYLVDLDSAKGTFISENHQKTRLLPYQPVLIKNGSIISFGESTRSYLVRFFPKAERLLQDRALSLSQNLFAGMSVSCEDEEMDDRPNGDMETKLHTNLNCMLSYSAKENSPRHQYSKSTFAPIVLPNSPRTAKEPIMSVPLKSRGFDRFETLCDRTRSISSSYNRKKRTAPTQGRIGRRKSAIVAGDRRVSFSSKCPELIPDSARGRSRSEVSSSSEDEPITRTFDPTKDLPDSTLSCIVENNPCTPKGSVGFDHQQFDRQQGEKSGRQHRSFASSGRDSIKGLFSRSSSSPTRNKENGQESPRPNRSFKAPLLRSGSGCKIFVDEPENTPKPNPSTLRTSIPRVRLAKSSSLTSLRELDVESNRSVSSKKVVETKMQGVSHLPPALSPRFTLTKSNSLTSLRDLERSRTKLNTTGNLRTSTGWTSIAHDTSNSPRNTSSVAAAAAAFSTMRSRKR